MLTTNICIYNIISNFFFLYFEISSSEYILYFCVSSYFIVSSMKILKYVAINKHKKYLCMDYVDIFVSHIYILFYFKNNKFLFILKYYDGVLTLTIT